MKSITLDELFKSVWQDHWSQERFQKSGHANQVFKNYENNIKGIFGSTKMNKIQKNDVKEWHQKLSQKPFAANRSLEVLSTLFRRAIENDLYTGANPCSFVKPYKEKSRKRYATQAELQKIGEILLKVGGRNKVGAAFLLTLLFTGARPRALERALHQDLTVTEEGYGVLISEGKSSAETGEDEQVIFPPKVMEVISKLPRRRDGRIFGIRIPSKLWNSIRDEAGCPDLWARDLRRTFATVGMSHGIKMDTISELLNHKSVQTTKIYAKLWDKERIKAVGQIATQMLFLLNNPEKNEAG